ncbi:MAG: phosphatidate cytidylyltransferase [Frankiales bacterium]|jgi:phosphatidate cytidylyltransferase|nr:phosphatidate cytidylyltransferase [Frankiales bacterium]
MAVDEAPAATPAEPSPAPAAGHGRAGRDLPVAIAVGLGLGALVLLTLFFARPWFQLIIVLAVGIGLVELRDALGTVRIRPPLVPLLAGAVAMPVAAYADGAEALVVALLLTVSAIVAWRLVEGPVGYLPDVAAGVLAAVYVPFCAGFCALLVAPSDGARRVIIFIAAVVCSDVGGYAAGVLWGRHRLAPLVSPKKSWEGLAGSAVTCMVAGGIMLPTMLGGAVWQGVVYGLAVVASATVGDLGESMVKRDLGIKDMGRLLPGHGGLMDRLDSLLPTAPVAWLLLVWFVPS